MIKVKDKTGRLIEVNNFVGSNDTLLKKYGYTRVDAPAQAPPLKKEEKKSVNPAAASVKEKTTLAPGKTETGI